jgi:hypothetical protein
MVKNQRKTVFPSLIRSITIKRYYPIVLLLAVALVFDFLTRVSPGSVDHGVVKNPSIFAKDVAQSVILSEDIYVGYLKKLKSLDATPAQEAKTEESQPISLIKSGEGVGWQIEGLDYRLVAVLKGKKEFAVLERFDGTTGVREVIQVAIGDSISGYEVAKLSAIGISFVNSEGDKVNLALFKPSDLNLS